MTAAGSGAGNYGAVFTRRWVVEALLDLTGYTASRDLGAMRLVEPSCGMGAFLGPAVERLIASARARGRDLASLGDAVRAYDLVGEHVTACRVICHDLLVQAGAAADTASAVAGRWVRQADFLLAGAGDRAADVVVGNPPYIRYDDLAPDTAVLYRRMWPTMQGRGDIYVGFIERSLRILASGGKAGFICADRWMRNSYGAALRELVASRYAVEHVWAMHDVDAFEQQVSAYPAITVLASHAQAEVVAADTTAEFGAASASALAWAAAAEGFSSFAGEGVTAHRLPRWFAGGELWPTGTPARLALVELLNDRFGPLNDPATGTRVSIGVATGADKVYVTRDPAVVEAGRLLPRAMRRDLMSGAFQWHGNYLVNPWAEDGSLVRLADYPRLAGYLSGHPEIRDRHVARKAEGSWYRTIDKVHAKLTNRPKLLLQDMKARIHPVLEPGGHYPHHNLYYLVSDTWDMEVLGGLLLSRVAYCVRMRGGTLRFQAQYLKRIRVPRPDQIAVATQDALRAAFWDRDTDAATRAAGDAYGVDLAACELA